MCRPTIPCNNMAHGAAGISRRLCAGGQHPPDPDRRRQSRRGRAALRERVAIVLRRRSARSRPAAVRSRADGRRAGRPHRLAVSGLSRRRRDRALGRRRAQGPCRAVRAAGDADLAGARLLPRNAVRGRGRGEARDLDARARWREPARQPRAFHRRDDLAGRRRRRCRRIFVANNMQPERRARSS